MRDIWGVLLQTLTASGAAVLLLIVKAMFRDKLPPKWQLSAWALLLGVLLIPAGAVGRYSLLNWPWLVEALKTVLTGDYSLVEVSAPVPLPAWKAPEAFGEWLYLVYVLGVGLLLLRYLVSYVRLRLALRQGTAADHAVSEKLRETAERYALPACPVVAVAGLQSAFVCGFVRPVLVVPAGLPVDEKVLLHELLHLKHRDILWGVAACLLRCVHWCNPLMWYCADQIGNDVESACDQRVLERLEGEERRAYGQILLSMANEKYPHAPGTSSISNGGNHIRRRIEAIARFKRYPAGMALVSICILILLATPMLGTSARSVYQAEGSFGRRIDLDVAMASARTTWCTTPAGALDAYSKALMAENGLYRAMCAPLEQQAELARQMEAAQKPGGWDTGLPRGIDLEFGYAIYNLEPVNDTVYRGLFVAALEEDPHRTDLEMNWHDIVSQQVTVENRGGRWIVRPQSGFVVNAHLGEPWLTWGFDFLPAYVYSDTADGFRAELRLQTIFLVDNTIRAENGMSWFMGPSTRFDAVPKPHADFDTVWRFDSSACIYVGEEAEKGKITSVGLSSAPLNEDGSRPELREVSGNSSGSSTDGSAWGCDQLQPGWANEVLMGGGGSSYGYDKHSFDLPDGYAAQLYINMEPKAELTLRRQEGGAA